MLEYEPYHAHTCYSNCLTQPDSTMFIKDYAKVYAERGHKVLCLSEHGNRSNVWEQFDTCEAYKAKGYTMTPLLRLKYTLCLTDRKRSMAKRMGVTST